MDVVRIFDTTLRDGEQSPGFSMKTDEKIRMARQLAKLGVDTIEAGFPISSRGDLEAVQAVAREVREETGLHVEPGRLVGAVERPAPGGAVFDIYDYAASVSGGQLVAGDDAADARWIDPGDIGQLALTSGLAETLATWGVLG